MIGGMVFPYAPLTTMPNSQLFAIDPDALSIIAAPNIHPATIGLDGGVLAVNSGRPHRDALVLAIRVDPAEVAHQIRSPNRRGRTLIAEETKEGVRHHAPRSRVLG
jgi:hypothetical protein